MEGIGENSLSDQLHSLGAQLRGWGWYFPTNAYFYYAQPVNHQKTDSIAKRIFLGLANGVLSVTSLVTFPGGILATWLANRLQAREYSYWKGKGKEIESDSHTAIHYNVCMFYGLLPYCFSGDAILETADERVDDLITFVKNEDPDIFFACEFNHSLSGKLYAATQEKYSHYFMNIGPHALKNSASMCCISRVPVVNPPVFYPSNAKPEGAQKMAYKGFFHVETPKLNYLYVHLHPKETERAKEIRREQIDEIKEIMKKDTSKRWVVLGDTNMDAFKGEKPEGFTNLVPEVQTCMGDEGAVECIDAVLVAKKIDATASVIESFSLSDHKAIKLQINS